MSLHLESRAHARAGRMTAAMRAAAEPTGARALRVAIVQDGRIVEERIFRERARVSELFDVADGAWVLCVPSGAVGHVVTGAGRFEVGPLASRVRLDESARGKIAVGATKYLFQLVVPPPKPARAQLPLATKRGDVDWTLTILVAFSFLVHFGIVGATFSDWMDPVVASEDNVVSVIDMTMKLPTGAVVEDRETGTPTQTQTQTPTPTHTPTQTQTPTHTSSETRAATLAHDAEAMQMSLLAAFGGTVAVDGALKRSDVPIGDLEASARQAGGAENTSSELRLATNSGVVTPGSALNTLGSTHGSTSTGHERVVEGPKFDLDMRVPDPPPFIDVERPIANMRPSFRSCYVRKGLSVDPAMEGKLTIDIRIAPNGDVADVTKVDGQGLSAAVEQCIIERAHNASFSAPGGSGAHARVPIIFRQQR